jgi:putative inorganic carbon (hco3(-)) transporter
VTGRRSYWLLAAFAGFFVATQPVALTMVAIVVISFMLLASITSVAALMFLLILAPLRTLIATEASFQLPVDIGQVALFGVLAAWLAHFIVSNRTLPKPPHSPLYIPLLLVLVFTSPGVFTALSAGAWVNEWLKWAQMLVLVIVVLTVVSGSAWQWLVLGLVLAGVANAVVGLYEFLGGSGAIHLLINDRFFRAFGTFGQPNPFGGFMGLLTPVALTCVFGYATRWWSKRRRIDGAATLFYAVSALILLTGIIISWSRGAWLAFAAALVVVLLALPHRSWHGLTLAGGMLIVGLALWVSGVVPESVVARISSATEEIFAFEDVRGVDITPDNYPVVERLAHWQAALNMTHAHPWLGVGLGNYEVAYPNFRLINWDEPLGHAHNYYLNILAEAGLIGLLGYGKAWLLIIWLNWRVRKHPDRLSRFVAVGLLGTWTFLSVHSLFDNLYVNNLFLHIGLMLGILGVLYNQVTCSTCLRSR